MIRRALAGTSVAIAAATLAMPLAPAGATGVARTAADAWADFQAPAAWDNPKDNLHWYVESPVITSAQVGRTATVAVTTPATLDCSSLGSGFGTAKGWRSVTLTTASCTGTSASVSYKVTRSMVGKRVSVLGWSAVSTRTATVDGKVTLGRSSTTATVTASRTDAVVPIATPTVLGTYQGKQVSIASAGGVNEVWVGNTRYSAPEGTVAHVSLDGSTVNLWIRNQHDSSGPIVRNTSSMDQWRLDVATGAVATQTIPVAQFLGSGESGFVVSTSDGDYIYYDHFYDWDGKQVGQEWTPAVGYPFITVNGFTRDAFVYTSVGQEGPTLTVLSNKGTVYGADYVGNGYSVEDSLLEITSIDADGVSYDKKAGVPHEEPNAANPLMHCRITAAGKSCVEA